MKTWNVTQQDALAKLQNNLESYNAKRELYGVKTYTLYNQKTGYDVRSEVAAIIVFGRLAGYVDSDISTLLSASQTTVFGKKAGRDVTKTVLSEDGLTFETKVIALGSPSEPSDTIKALRKKLSAMGMSLPAENVIVGKRGRSKASTDFGTLESDIFSEFVAEPEPKTETETPEPKTETETPEPKLETETPEPKAKTGKGKK